MRELSGDTLGTASGQNTRKRKKAKHIASECGGVSNELGVCC